MSPQWRDEIHIWIAAAELRIRRMRRGLRPTCVADATYAIDSTSDWKPVLAALDTNLAAATWSGAPARVVVSNRFARYAIVPWSDTLTRDAEHVAHARICLAGNYGTTGPDWRVCISEAAPGEARVACALPEGMLAGLRTVCDAHQVRISGVQPALIDAYNRCRQLLPRTACWFVNIEPSALVAARLAPRGWESVYSARIGADWPTELMRLRMFARLAAQNTADARVYVDAPERLRHIADCDEPDIEWLANSDATASADPDQRQSLRLQT